MPKSATDVMQEAMLAAVVDAIIALKDASKGVPNTLLRDLNAIHANTSFADLPPVLQSAIAASVRSGFNRFLKEGYSVAPGAGTPQARKAETVRRDGPAKLRRPGGGKAGEPEKAPPGNNQPRGERRRNRPGPKST
jgi:hypothetical protein